MQHLELHSLPLGLTGREILVSLIIAVAALVLTAVVGLFVLLLTS